MNKHKIERLEKTLATELQKKHGSQPITIYFGPDWDEYGEPCREPRELIDIDRHHCKDVKTGEIMRVFGAMYET